MGAKRRLKDVTVCAADSLHPDLAGRALDICLEKVDFADVVLFADTSIAGRFRYEAIPKLGSSADYSRFCLQEMAKRIKPLGLSSSDKAALVDFLMNALTDCRTEREEAPFDHPSLVVPNGPSVPATGGGHTCR